jgi:hypothetical protein
MTARPSRPRLVLHCGANKTGTTAVQVACYNNRPLLKEMGILYPDLDTQGITARSHYPLAVAFQEQPENYYIMKDNGFDAATAQAYAADIRKIFLSQVAASNCDIVFVSSEAIGQLSPRELAGCDAFLREHFRQVELIYYARAPLDSLLSFFQQNLRGGNNTNIKTLSEHKMMAFGATAHELKVQFGDSLRLRLFQRDELYKRDIVADLFHELMGIGDLPAGFAAQSTNVALSAQSSAFLYFANKKIPRRLNGRLNPLFTEVNLVAEKYTRDYSYTSSAKLRLPSDAWAAFIRSALAQDYLLFLSHAGFHEKAAVFSKQLTKDKQELSTLVAPNAKEVERWMYRSIAGFRFDLIPEHIANIVRSAVAESHAQR